MENIKINEEQLLCEYNGVMSLGDLDNMVPGTIYLSKLHVDICSKIACTFQFPENEERLFINFLSKNSKVTKSITALISLVKAGKLKPVVINSKYITFNILDGYIDLSRVKIINSNNVAKQFIDKGQIKRILFKLIANKLYRLFFRKMKNNFAIRSWVEITQSMYGDKYNDSLILIYPFYLNIKRHIIYIRQCFSRYKCVTFCGLPYSIFDYLKIIMSSQNKDLNCIKFELNAYRKHAQELVSLGVKHLYTSDEFEVGAFIMVETLQNSGAEVINTAHGMSFGCPYVSYDTFRVYNSAQAAYYSHKSDKVKYIVSPRSNTDPVNCLMDNKKDNKVLIYLDSYYEQTGIRYNTHLEYEAIDALRELGSALRVDVIIKLHPNRKAPADLTSHTISGVKVIRHLTELKEKEPIFISFYTAAYYDFRHLGPFIFIYDGFVSPEEIYGEDGLVCVPLEEIDNEVLKYLN